MFNRITHPYRTLWQRKSIREFLRFCLVGVVATAIHYGVYFLLNKLFGTERLIWTNINYSIGYLISWFCNLWLTAHFTFNKDVTFKRGFGFAICHGVNYMLHLLFLNIFLSMGFPKNLAPIPVYAIVVPINFILIRAVFNRIAK